VPAGKDAVTTSPIPVSGGRAPSSSSGAPERSRLMLAPSVAVQVSTVDGRTALELPLAATVAEKNQLSVRT
jgi:hypothetical protein